MSIWTFQDYFPGRASRIGFRSSECPYCKTPLSSLGTIGHILDIEKRGWACPACGWWKVEAERDVSGPTFIPDTDVVGSELRYAHGTLVNFSVKDWAGPLDELQRYLVVRYDAIGEVSPRKVEEIAADIFKNLGYRAELTAYSKDGGIDVIVTEPRDGERIAVQVKRYKDRVGVEPVRSFVGAMTLQGFTRGIFIATGGFTAPARALEDTDVVGLELQDGQQFFEQLRISRRPAYYSLDDEGAPYFRLVRDFQSMPLIEFSSSAVPSRFGW